MIVEGVNVIHGLSENLFGSTLNNFIFLLTLFEAGGMFNTPSTIKQP